MSYDPASSYRARNASERVPPRSSKVGALYKTDRLRAWRNLLVSAINGGLREGLFTLDDGANAWPGASSSPSEGYTYGFALAPGMPGLAHVADIGWGELRIHAIANPIGRLASLSMPSMAAGDAFAIGFLERKESKWLQTSATLFKCRREIQPVLAALRVEPLGYLDHGRLIL